MTTIFSRKHLIVLHHMWVSTNNQIYAKVSQPLPYPLLVGIVLELVFRSPMDVHNTEVDRGILHTAGKVNLNLLSLDIIDTIRPYRKQTVGAISGIEQSNLHTIDMEN